MHNAISQDKRQQKDSERARRRRHRGLIKKDSGACCLWRQVREPAHFQLNGPSCTLTILVLTNFSIALTSSAALGTSVEPWRAASSEEDCKARFKEEGHVSRDGEKDREGREEGGREESERERGGGEKARKKEREDVNQQEFGTTGVFTRRSLGEGNRIALVSWPKVVCVCLM